MKRKPRNSGSSYDREVDRDYDRDYDGYSSPESSKQKPAKSSIAALFNATALAVLAGVFILGIGIGLGFSSVSSSGAGKIVTDLDLSQRAPNAELCAQFGSAAITMDARVFVTLNPLNVYISQPSTQPGCVLRTNNWSILEQRGLVKSEQVRDCKNRMNTFGFTDALERSPRIDCIYQNDAAKNLFLNQPGTGGAPKPENEKY
ncbi:MAG: DUF3172 domain-containing protein [Stenomitos rutilans HA7619-LM2]|jgi:hypothetical protein|nr:DUF3172 domain-containing protein [Stenomitos rutilans HA7619-LM2]